MRKLISSAIAAIAVAVPLSACGGGGIGKIGEEAGSAASRAGKAAQELKEDTQPIRQIHSAGCSRPKIGEWSDTLQGKDTDGAPTC